MKGRKILVLFIAFVLLIGIMTVPASAAMYEVQSGDMLYKIAQKYNVTIQEIVDANKIKNPDLIYVGDMLTIPDKQVISKTVDITLIHTNDVHSRVSEGSSDGMGYDKVSTLIKNEKAKNPNVLVMDAGDAFHGQTISTLNKGESIVKIMNMTGYNLMTPGNHDFNYGQTRLLELAKLADFEILSANIYEKDYSLFLPGYTIKEFDGVKVAVFGLSTPDTTFTTHPDNVIGLNFLDPVIIARMMVAQLSDKADIIICLAHLGVDEGSKYTSKMIAQYVEGLDVIVDGHSHTAMEAGILVNNTLIVQTGEYTKNVGIVNLKYNNGVLTKTAKLITKEEGIALASDSAIVALVDEIKAGNEVITSEVVGNTTIQLLGERQDVRTGETNLGNLITDAMLAETGADIAFTNGGGIRASIDVGDITVGEVITVLPFGNYVVTKECTGAQVIAALENGLTDYPATKGAFPHIGGMTVVFDPGKAAGSRVVEVKVDGELIVNDKLYIVATNDFMAAGGDLYTMFGVARKVGEYPGLDEVLINYIKSHGTAGSPVEGRIKTVDEVSFIRNEIAA